MSKGDEITEAIARLNEADRAVARWEDARARESEAEGKPLYTARKAARNHLAELLQDAGLHNFTIGHDR